MSSADDRTRAAPTGSGPPAGPRGWAPGERVGPFVVKALLGQGGMGAVYAVTHTTTGADHALKVLLAVDDAAGRARFAREGQAQASLPPHPNVVRVLGAGELQGAPYLLTELAPGGDLRVRLRQGPLEPAQAARLFVGLARALVHLHAHGVLHRDLKPHNVVFGADGAPKLMDFGLAALRGADKLTATGAFMGTPNYMAPEQVDGQKVDARADVYGLGATLYQSLCGRPPFDGEQGLNIITKILTQAPRSLRSMRPDLPADLVRVVERAMARELADRYPSAEAFAADLERVAAGQPLDPQARRARAPLLVGAALVVILGGAAAALAARSASRPVEQPAPSPAGVPPAPVASAAPALVWDATRTGRLVPADHARVTLPDLPAGRRFTRGEDVETSWSGEVELAEGLNVLVVRQGRRRLESCAVVRLPRGLSLDARSDGRVAINDVDGSRLLLVEGIVPTDGRAPIPTFLLGELEATRGQLERWAAEAPGRALPERRAPLQPLPPESLAKLPATGLPFPTVEAYCARVGLRLPTTEEWGHACFGPERARYPWGDGEPTAARGNFLLAKGLPSGPTVVGSFPDGRSWCGALDLFGNADEWVAPRDGLGRTCGPSWADEASKHISQDGEGADRKLTRNARGFRTACDLVRAVAPEPLPP